MAEIQIDSDWKKQAQEEKRRLAEEAEKKKAAAAPASSPTGGGASGRSTGNRATRELPAPGLASVVQLLSTQALYYLGELSSAGEAAMDLDLAKHQIDTLAVLEEKTRGNLSPDEQALFDNALYDSRMRFVAVAQQYIR